MKIFVGYSTKEGQTRKVARYVADQLFDLGHSVEIAALTEGDAIDLLRFDGAILGGSIHVGHYQKSLSEFTAAHQGALNAMPTLLLSLSLAAAGHDAEDWRALDKIGDDFQQATGWHPSQIAQIAGAYKPTDYDILTRFIMRRIIVKKDPDAALDQDKEYTDWAALKGTIETWLETLAP